MAAPAKTSTALTGPQLDNRRVAAALIDLLIPLTGVAVAYAAGLSLTRGLLLVGVGWTLYYFFALESGHGQTLGKRVMKLRVVSADGTPATTGQIAKRTVVRILDGHLVGLIVMLATGERRLRLGDIVAGTVVTDAASASGAPEADLERLAAAPAPEQPAPAQPTFEPAAAKPPFFKRRLSLPSFGAKRRRKGAADPSADLPEPVHHGRVTDPLRAGAPAAVEPFAAFDRPDVAELRPSVAPDGPEPSIELDGPEPSIELDPPEASDEADEPDPIADLGGREPVVELDEPDREPEAEPQPATDSLAELEPWAEREVRALTERAADPVAGPEAEVDPDHDPGLTIKPVETVSAIDLVMQDAEERRPAAD